MKITTTKFEISVLDQVGSLRGDSNVGKLVGGSICGGSCFACEIPISFAVIIYSCSSLISHGGLLMPKAQL